MDTMKDTKMQPATDAVIEELRMLAEDLYVNGYNRYSSAMSQAADELERLRAKIAEMEKQEPVAWMLNCQTLGGDTGWILSWTQSGAGLCNRLQGDENEKRLYALPGAPAQPAKNAVAYLDLGTGGYMDVGTDLTDEELATLPKGRHMLGIIGTYGVDGYVPAQPAPSVPEGWLRAIDEALVTTHIGVANAHDTYEQAKAKLDNLIGFHVDVATDPAVNGGWKLVPIVSTDEMDNAGSEHCDGYLSTAQVVWDAMLAAAPEAKS